MKKRFVKHCKEEVLAFDDVMWNEGGIEQYFRAVRQWKEQSMAVIWSTITQSSTPTTLLKSLLLENLDERQ